MPLSNKDLFDAIPPDILGVLLAMFISILRVIYDKKETSKVRIFLESLICGGLSVTASAAIIALGLEENWAVFAGGTIGYFGSATVRSVALKFLNKQIDHEE